MRRSNRALLVWRSPRSVASSVVLFAVACATPAPGAKPSADRDSGGAVDPADTGPEVDPWPEPAPCEASDIVEVAAWTDATLPQRHPLRKTMQGVGVGDLNGDGWLDVLVAWGGGSFGLINDGAGVLEFSEAVRGEDGPLPPGVSVALADLDGDGDLDGLLGMWDVDVQQLINDGTGVFTRRSIPGSAGDTVSITLADFDGDGDLDAYTSAAASDMQYEDIAAGLQVGDENRLLMQGADGSFTVENDRLPAGTGHGMSLHSGVLDVEGDGDLDIYVGNDAGPYVLPNLLLLNDGTGHFLRDEDCGCEVPMLAMGVAVGDADQDSVPDLYISDVGPPKLLLNQADGSFADFSLGSGADIPATAESMVSWGTAFFDQDRDRIDDLVVTFGQSGQNFHTSGFEGVDGEWQPDQLLRGLGGARFERLDAPGFLDGSRSRAVALGDFDRDGRADLVTTGKYFVRQWRSTGGCGPGATVKLRGRAVVGATVRSTVAGVERVQWLLPSTSGSSSADEVSVGFGGHAAAERIEVVLPSGAVSVHVGVAAGSVVEVDADALTAR